ncbi:MAG: tetratricopeptide repeat protein [Vicinamibacterales bacterium]
MKAAARLIVAATIAVATATGAAAQSPAAAAPDNRVMVVPFENANGAARVYWLAEASAVLLTDDLTALGVRAMPREERLLAFEQLGIPPSPVLSHATVIRTGQLVGAAQVVVGSYTLTGETLTVRARAIQLDSGRLLPEVSESGPLPEIFQIYGRVARRLASDSSPSSGDPETGHPPLPAFEQYIKGLVARSPSTQVGFFSQALTLSPAFHRARLGLWTVYTEQGEHQRALEVVRQVSPNQPLSRRARFLASLSMLELAQYGPAADALGDLGRERPDASIVNNQGIIQFRRPAGTSLVKASFFFEEAARMDPSDASLFFNLGYARWTERDLAGAVDALREVVRRDPADGDAHFVLAVVLQASGSSVEAGRERELARQLSSKYAEWEARPGGITTMPRGLERVKTELDVPPALRLNDAIVAAGQRDQQDQALFHLESGKRLFQAEHDAEAVAELRRAVYLAPYQSEAHLMLGRVYLRTGRLSLAVSELKISIWSADTIAARLALAETYLQLKDPAAARSEAQVVLRRDPGNLDARRITERVAAN